MSDSLKNQLLGLGFKPVPAPERQPERQSESRRPPPPAGDARRGSGRGRPEARRAGAPGRGSGEPRSAPSAGAKNARSQEELDLAKAYALRGEQEKRERIAAEQAKQEEARLRREAKARLKLLLEGQALNVADADHVRHFEYGGKIKRIHVTEGQLRQLNAGELGVVQNDGRYLLVTAAVLAEAEQAFAPAIALKVDPNAPAADDPYADPRYQVPDDLVW